MRRAGRNYIEGMRATTAFAALFVLAACSSDEVVKPTTLSPPLVTAVVVEGPTDLLSPGDFLQLEARAIDVFGRTIPDARFSWTSTNTDIATVDKGLVYAVAPGNVAIRAVSERVSGRIALAIRVIPPVIQELEPSSSVPNQPLTLTVRGYGFYRGSVVRLNNQSKPTTYVTGRLLRAEIAASDIPAAGSYQVRVYNAVSGAGFSNTFDFEVR